MVHPILEAYSLFITSLLDLTQKSVAVLVLWISRSCTVYHCAKQYIFPLGKKMSHLLFFSRQNR